MTALDSDRVRRAPAPSEESIHRAVVQYIERAVRPGVFWFHVPNGGARHRAEGGKLKAHGARAGVPDLIFVKDGRCCGLELKTECGRVSTAQQAAHTGLMMAGAEVDVAYGLDEAIEQLKAWGITR